MSLDELSLDELAELSEEGDDMDDGDDTEEDESDDVELSLWSTTFGGSFLCLSLYASVVDSLADDQDDLD